MARIVLAILMVIAAATLTPVRAGEHDPLFVNLTSDDAHRVTMALTFSRSQLERGHPVTLFLNDKGVLVASKQQAGRFSNQQAILNALIAQGATVIVCPMCMKANKVAEADLVGGAKVGNPALTGAALFQDQGKTLSW